MNRINNNDLAKLKNFYTENSMMMITHQNYNLEIISDNPLWDLAEKIESKEGYIIPIKMNIESKSVGRVFKKYLWLTGNSDRILGGAFFLLASGNPKYITITFLKEILGGKTLGDIDDLLVAIFDRENNFITVMNDLIVIEGAESKISYNFHRLNNEKFMKSNPQLQRTIVVDLLYQHYKQRSLINEEHLFSTVALITDKKVKDFKINNTNSLNYESLVYSDFEISGTLLDFEAE